MSLEQGVAFLLLLVLAVLVIALGSLIGCSSALKEHRRLSMSKGKQCGDWSASKYVSLNNARPLDDVIIEHNKSRVEFIENYIEKDSVDNMNYYISLNKQIASFKDRVAQLEENLRVRRITIERLRHQIECKNDEIVKQDSLIKLQQEETKALQNDLGRAEVEVIRLKGHMDYKNDELAGKEVVINEQANEIKVLRSVISECCEDDSPRREPVDHKYKKSKK